MATTDAAPAVAATSTSKTPCAFFAQGKCRNGAACSFYHAPREDLAVSPLPCKFFLQNACKAGAFFMYPCTELSICGRCMLMSCVYVFVCGSTGRECKFSHITDADAQAALMSVSASTGEKAIAPGTFRVPCKFYQKSECSAGDKCPYLHTKKGSLLSDGSQKEQKKKKESSVKMYVLNPKPAAKSAASREGGDEAEEKAAAWGANRSAEDPSEQHLSDFLTKEEGMLLQQCVLWVHGMCVCG